MWEYRIFNKEITESILNQLGSERWELITYNTSVYTTSMGYNNTAYCIVLKRQTF